jgi:hypothetical protein
LRDVLFFCFCFRVQRKAEYLGVLNEGGPHRSDVGESGGGGDGGLCAREEQHVHGLHGGVAHRLVAREHQAEHAAHALVRAVHAKLPEAHQQTGA